MTGGSARIAACIDHTLLDPLAVGRDIDRLCDEARRYGFAAVCVLPVWIERTAAALDGTGIAVAAVIGFPHGGDTSAAKVCAAEDAVDRGATELDVVAPLGRIADGDAAAVETGTRALVRAIRGRARVKVILETAAFEPDTVEKAARAAVRGGTDYVKTSTGQHPAGGATVEAVARLRDAVGPDVGVKAAGGIRTADQARRMIDAGANRIGTSSGPALIDDGGGDAR